MSQSLTGGTWFYAVGVILSCSVAEARIWIVNQQDTRATDYGEGASDSAAG